MTLLIRTLAILSLLAGCAAAPPADMVFAQLDGERITVEQLVTMPKQDRVRVYRRLGLHDNGEPMRSNERVFVIDHENAATLRAMFQRSLERDQAIVDLLLEIRVLTEREHEQMQKAMKP